MVVGAVTLFAVYYNKSKGFTKFSLCSLQITRFGVKRTSGGIAELPADHLGINRLPGIITHRAPVPVDTDLNTTLISAAASSKPDISMCAVCRLANIGLPLTHMEQVSFLIIIYASITPHWKELHIGT